VCRRVISSPGSTNEHSADPYINCKHWTSHTYPHQTFICVSLYFHYAHDSHYAHYLHDPHSQRGVLSLTHIHSLDIALLTSLILLRSLTLLTLPTFTATRINVTTIVQPFTALHFTQITHTTLALKHVLFFSTVQLKLILLTLSTLFMTDIDYSHYSRYSWLTLNAYITHITHFIHKSHCLLILLTLFMNHIDYSHYSLYSWLTLISHITHGIQNSHWLLSLLTLFMTHIVQTFSCTACSAEKQDMP